MLYEIAHFVKDHLTFMWDVIEWGNSVAFSVKYRKGLRNIDEIVNEGVPEPYGMRAVQVGDVAVLRDFFAGQPEEAFAYFNPHGFDEKSLKKIVRRKSFLAFLLIVHGTAGDEIVGYAFMRSFLNGSSYRGYMVDVKHRGRGLAKIIGFGLNRVGDALNLTMYKSISPENPASMKATEKVCDIKILKTLENGDYLMKCTSKASDTMIDEILTGGGDLVLQRILNQVFMPQIQLNYAA